MGLSGISFWELLLVALVLLLLFGSKKLPGIATDLGTAIRGFRRSVSGDPPAAESSAESADRDGDPPSGRPV